MTNPRNWEYVSSDDFFKLYLKVGTNELTGATIQIVHVKTDSESDKTTDYDWAEFMDCELHTIIEMAIGAIVNGGPLFVIAST